ncbi:MAG: hypothetical protein JWM76_1082 [Pseudonocardiales bacterium]|nr:hypothetical protein [Pseudonocardiales bacterium]
MTDYEISVLFDDTTDELIVPLNGVEHETAEQFTAELRSNVEHAKTIDAPVIDVTLPDAAGSELTLDPRRVRAIDLEVKSHTPD